MDGSFSLWCSAALLDIFGADAINFAKQKRSTLVKTSSYKEARLLLLNSSSDL